MKGEKPGTKGRPRWVMLLNDLNPAFGGFNSAHLDAGEGVVQLLDGGAHAGVVNFLP